MTTSPSGVRWNVIFNHFPEIARALQPKAMAIVARTALAIEGGAKSRAPVDTGTLRNSIQSSPSGTSSWVVTVGADYGIYVEYGTRFMAAQPYFTPAIDAERPRFQYEMRALI